MITRFSKALCAAALAALSLTGCGSGETYPMASPEGLDRIKELIRTNVDTSKNKIYQVSWHEDRGDRKLENILTEVEAYYTDTENNDYRIAFTLTDGQFVTDGPKKSDRQYNSYECSTPLDLEAINLEYLKKICEEAEAMVKADEQGQKLTLRSAGMFRFRVWPVLLRETDRWNRSEEFREESKQLEVDFEFNFVDVNESPEYQGRSIVTNYYTVAFTANAAGEVSIDE